MQLSGRRQLLACAQTDHYSSLRHCCEDSAVFSHWLDTLDTDYVFLTAQRYDSAINAMVLCPSVRVSQADALSKGLNVSARQQRRMVAEGL